MHKRTLFPSDDKESKNLALFLRKFPMNEMWRFFIERNCFDVQHDIYCKVYRLKNRLPETAKIDMDLKSLKNELKEVKVADVFELVEREKQYEFKHILDYHKLNEKKDEPLTSCLDKQKGWLGFEEREENYLRGVMRGFALILQKLSSGKREPLDLKFITELHNTCTKEVKNMGTSHQSGAFRKEGAAWGCNSRWDTEEGWAENLSYLSELSKKLKDMNDIPGPALVFALYFQKDCPVCPACPDFDDATKMFSDIGYWPVCHGIDVQTYVKTIFAREDLTQIHFVAMYEIEVSSKKEDFLNEACNMLIKKLETDLSQAKTKEEKLTAIFSYIKFTVLHHPFQDGVGRTYSMLLLQYLLMREDLLPFIIPNSNVIPGHSVKELINIYLKGEKEMEMILKAPEYIASQEFASPNISTTKELNRMTVAEKMYFEQCISEVTKVVDDILSSTMPKHTAPSDSKTHRRSI